MSRALLVLAGRAERDKARRWIEQAPVNTRVTFQGPKRSLPQNDRMWAMLTDIADQRTWHGVKLGAADWKVLFLGALKSEMRIVPNLNGDGFIQLGRSSSDLSREEMSDLIELIAAWGAQNGVEFHDSEGPDRANNPAGAAA